MTDRITTLKIYLLKSFLWWVVIAWFASATIGHRNPWLGIWIELCLIPMGAYTLSWTMPKRWVFVYGCGCSLSLMHRLYYLLRSWEFAESSKSVLALWLIGMVLTLGFGCYIVSLVHAAIHSQTPKPPGPGFAPGRLLLTSGFSFFFLLGTIIYLVHQRQLLTNPFVGPQAMFTIPILASSAIAGGYFLLFVGGNVQVRSSCFTPGGVLLMGIATLTIYWLVALLSQVCLNIDRPFYSNTSSFDSLTTTGMLSAALLIGLHIRFRTTWRLPLALIVASLVVAAFLRGTPHPHPSVCLLRAHCCDNADPCRFCYSRQTHLDHAQRRLAGSGLLSCNGEPDVCPLALNRI